MKRSDLADPPARIRPVSQPRGEDARRRILDAALELFARDGFDRASTRDLAERAGVNLPAIQYYFGSKEGLYRTVVEEIIHLMDSRIGPLATRIQTELETADPSRAQLVAMLREIIEAVVGLMLDDAAPGRQVRQKFFARMEAEPDAAFEALQACMIRTVCVPCRLLVGRLTGLPADDERVLLRVMTTIGLAKVFCGWGVAGFLGWTTIGPDRVRIVQTTIGDQIEDLFLQERSSTV